MSKITIDRELLEKAIEAMDGVHAGEHHGGIEESIAAMREALAQPQQEPVAKIQVTHYKGEVDGWRFVERPRNAPAGTYYVYASPQPVQPQPDQQ